MREVYHVDGRWCVRDMQSLNGTLINGEKLDSEWELTAEDEISLGSTRLLFLEDIGQLPGVAVPAQQEQLAIKKRLSHTRFLTPPTGDDRCSRPFAAVACFGSPQPEQRSEPAVSARCGYGYRADVSRGRGWY